MGHKMHGCGTRCVTGVWRRNRRGVSMKVRSGEPGKKTKHMQFSLFLTIFRVDIGIRDIDLDRFFLLLFIESERNDLAFSTHLFPCLVKVILMVKKLLKKGKKIIPSIHPVRYQYFSRKHLNLFRTRVLDGNWCIMIKEKKIYVNNIYMKTIAICLCKKKKTWILFWISCKKCIHTKLAVLTCCKW